MSHRRLIDVETMSSVYGVVRFTHNFLCFFWDVFEPDPLATWLLIKKTCIDTDSLKRDLMLSYHGTIIGTGITCKKIPCYMCDSACRWFIVKKAKIF